MASTSIFVVLAVNLFVGLSKCQQLQDNPKQLAQTTDLSPRRLLPGSGGSGGRGLLQVSALHDDEQASRGKSLPAMPRLLPSGGGNTGNQNGHRHLMAVTAAASLAQADSNRAVPRLLPSGGSNSGNKGGHRHLMVATATAPHAQADGNVAVPRLLPSGGSNVGNKGGRRYLTAATAMATHAQADGNLAVPRLLPSGGSNGGNKGGRRH